MYVIIYDPPIFQSGFCIRRGGKTGQPDPL